MNQRDRQWATLIIWTVFIFLFLLVLDRVLFVTADYSGLWPQSPIFQTAQEADQLNQVVTMAREALPGVLTQIQTTMRDELARRIPAVAALTAMLLATATLCTWVIWRNAGLEAYLAREVVQAEKAKRRSRIEQFMDDLDTDELDQLRDRLSDDAKARR